MRTVLFLFHSSTLLLILGLAGCSKSSSGSPGPVPVDGGGDGGGEDANGTKTWLSVETQPSASDILVEKVTYRSGPYKIYGQVCRPAAPGRHPLRVENHGGWKGLGDEWKEGSFCRNGAKNGYVVIQSAYRGEDGSEGDIEICLGEVDDVLNMIEIARAQPYVDTARAGLFGGSHGGCITLRALERGAPVQTAIAMAPATDWSALYAYWQKEEPRAPAPLAASYRELMERMRASTGGTPAEKANAYRARTVDRAALERRAEAIVLLHGNNDVIVPLEHTCRLVAGMNGVRAYHLDGQQRETASAPTSCGGVTGITWTATARPTPAWPDARYFVAYDGFGHGLDESAATRTALADSWTAFVARVPK